VSNLFDAGGWISLGRQASHYQSFVLVTIYQLERLERNRMRRRVKHRSNTAAAFRWIFLASLFGLIPVSRSFADEYRIDTGDVLEISAPSVPDFRYRATVGSSGEVWFPLVGVIPARNQPFSEILTIVRDRISQKLLRRHTAEGS